MTDRTEFEECEYSALEDIEIEVDIDRLASLAARIHSMDNEKKELEREYQMIRKKLNDALKSKKNNIQ